MAGLEDVTCVIIRPILSPPPLTVRAPSSKVTAETPPATPDWVQLDAVSPISRPLPSAVANPSSPAPEVKSLTEVPALSKIRPDSLKAARTLGVLLKRMEPHMSPESQYELRNNSDLVGVLCGEMSLARVRLEGKAADDLKAVVHCLGLTTREYLAIVEDPLQPGQFTVLNKAEINLSVPEVRWGLTLNADSFTPQAAARVEALNEKGRHNAAACLAESRKVGQPVESGERIPRQIGMIVYVDSPEALQRFHSVIHEWRENVQDFGHRNVVFRLCDDSPEPFSSKIRSLLEQQPKDAIQFQYIGPEQKAQLRASLEQALQPALGPQDAAQVAALVGGAGATQNRNLSLQLLGKQGGLQMDHDMTPEILTSHWEDPIPFDILGSLEGESNSYGIRSFSFSGAHDVSIEHILKSDHGMAPRRIRDSEQAFMGNQVRGPMFVSKNVSQAARIAPGLRDGDLALTQVSQKVDSYSSKGLVEAVYHRDQAGGRWSGGHLMRQYLLYECCDEAISKWVDESAEGHPEKVGQAILKGLEQQTCWNQVSRSSFFGRSKEALQDYYSGLPSDHPERQNIREGLFLDPNQGINTEKLNASLHEEARGLLRTHALALVHSKTIEDCLGAQVRA